MSTPNVAGVARGHQETSHQMWNSIRQKRLCRIFPGLLPHVVQLGAVTYMVRLKTFNFETTRRH
jgi:hypothetical protein